MVFTFSNNPFDRFSCWFEDNVIEPISRKYYKNKKAHYQCTVCHIIEAPYFRETQYPSITEDFGWHRLRGKYPRYVCHHCADHGFREEFEPEEYGYTWSEWSRIVDKNNEEILALIKEKDPEYYEYWFNGGREEELFGDCEDE